MFGFGVQGSAGPLVGKAIGEGNIQKSKAIVLAGWAIGVIYIVLFVIFYLMLSEEIASIYSTDPRVLEIMVKSAPFVALCLVLDTSMLSLSSAVIGLGY